MQSLRTIDDFIATGCDGSVITELVRRYWDCLTCCKKLHKKWNISTCKCTKTNETKFRLSDIFYVSCPQKRGLAQTKRLFWRHQSTVNAFLGHLYIRTICYLLFKTYSLGLTQTDMGTSGRPKVPCRTVWRSTSLPTVLRRTGGSCGGPPGVLLPPGVQDPFVKTSTPKTVSPCSNPLQSSMLLRFLLHHQTTKPALPHRWRHRPPSTPPSRAELQETLPFPAGARSGDLSEDLLSKPRPGRRTRVRPSASLLVLKTTSCH